MTYHFEIPGYSVTDICVYYGDRDWSVAYFVEWSKLNWKLTYVRIMHGDFYYYIYIKINNVMGVFSFNCVLCVLIILVGNIPCMILMTQSKHTSRSGRSHWTAHTKFTIIIITNLLYLMQFWLYVYFLEGYICKKFQVVVLHIARGFFSVISVS